MGWTQPVCNNCWDEQNPDRDPYRIRTEYAEEEICAFCGISTRSGIYTRVDPKTVPYPRKDIDE